MTKTQTALTDLLVAAGVEPGRIFDSPDGDTVVVERPAYAGRIVVGYDWSEDDAAGNELILGADDMPTWVDYTCYSADDDIEGTDGAEPTEAARKVAVLVNG